VSVRTPLLALLLACAPASAATWQSFVDAGLASPAPVPALQELHVEALNAPQLVSVLDSARVSLPAIAALPNEAQAAAIRNAVGVYAQTLLSDLPAEEKLKALASGDVADTYRRLDALRGVLGALPEDKREPLLAAHAALWREASRRGMDKLLREPASWKPREEDDAVAVPAAGARKPWAGLVRATPGEQAPPRRGEPPLPPSYDGHAVTIDGRPFARTGRGLEELKGVFPDDFLDASGLRGKKVLDAATGAGTFVYDLRALGVDAVGSDAFLGPRQREHPEAFRPGRLERLPYADGAFDYVYSSWGPFVYDHEQDDKYVVYLKEIARVLKKGGRARLSPFLARDLSAVLKEVPELALSPDVTYGRLERGAYMQRAVEWKGKTWTGDPFIELVRR